MKSIKKTKLGLHRETIRQLDADALAGVHGGAGWSGGSSCAVICASCNESVCVGASCNAKSCAGSCGPSCVGC